MNFEKLKRINDDGWKETIVICLVVMVTCFCYVQISIVAIASFVLGNLFEETLEWLGHGWVQHYPSKIFDFIERHKRHHNETRVHHAIQPITHFVVASIVLLLPVFIVMYFGYVSLGCSFIAGYCLSHIILNILHYDIHAPIAKKIVPSILRKTGYYKLVEKLHIAHHRHDDSFGYRIYGVTNPWLDMLYQKIRLDKLVDRIYPEIIKFID